MNSIVLTSAQSRPALAAVMPNCLSAIRGEPDSLGLPAVRGVVVMLVDGLGVAPLMARSGHGRRLLSGQDAAATAFSFPSTTAAGITQLTTARAAGEHGMVGYEVWDRTCGVLRNQLSGWGPGMEPASWQLRPTVFEQLRGSGVRPTVISVAEYADSGLTNASLRGARFIAGASMRERCELAARVCRAAGNHLVYLYHAELDQAGHRYGCGSDAWIEQLEELDAAFAQLLNELPDDIGVLVTADHGMVDIAKESYREFNTDLLDGVAAIAGEPRLRHLYLSDPSARASLELSRRIADEEAGQAVVCTRAEAIAAGWFGADIDPRAEARIGDVLVAATAELTYHAPGTPESKRRMIGQHGSITDAETLVPLLRHGAFAG